MRQAQRSASVGWGEGRQVVAVVTRPTPCVVCHLSAHCDSQSESNGVGGPSSVKLPILHGQTLWIIY